MTIAQNDTVKPLFADTAPTPAAVSTPAAAPTPTSTPASTAALTPTTTPTLAPETASTSTTTPVATPATSVTSTSTTATSAALTADKPTIDTQPQATQVQKSLPIPGLEATRDTTQTPAATSVDTVDNVDMAAAKLTPAEANQTKTVNVTGLENKKRISAGLIQPKPTSKAPPIPLMLDNPQSGTSSITGAIQTTLATHPQILEQFANQLAAKADIGVAKGDLLPSLDISGGIGPENTDNPATRANAAVNGGSGDVSLTRRESQILLRQLLFDGGNVTNRIRQASANYETNAYQLWEAKELLSFNAADVYLNVLRQRELVEIEMLDVDAHEELNRKIMRRYQAGAGTKADVELATSRLAQARAQLTQAEGALANANDAYVRIVGAYPTVTLKSPFVPQHLPGSLAQAQQLGMVMSPTIQASLAQVASAQAAAGVARSAFYPTVSIDVTERHDDNLDGVLGNTNQRQALIRASYNVFRGGSDAAAVSAANYRITAAINQAKQARRDVGFDIAQSWNNLLANLDRIHNLTIHQNESYLVWQAYIKQFQLGQRTLFDMLNAQSEYYNSRSAVINATYDAMSARYQLLASMGALVGTITNPSADVFRRVPLTSQIRPGESHAQMVPEVGTNVPPPTTHLPNMS